MSPAAESCSTAPAQIGPELEAAGAAGLSNTVIVDQNNNTGSVGLAASAIDASKPITLNAGIPTPTGGARSYIYARIGVRTVGASEQIYSSPVKINL